METLRVSHWPITWLIYLPCTMAQGQSHCAPNIISNSHPFHSKWVKPPISVTVTIIYLENRRSGSWVKTKLKVTTWGQHSINSHPFRFMSSSHPIPEIWLFQNLTLKIQGQGHGWGERWKSQSRCNILPTHIPFVPCQLAIPFLRYNFLKIWPWKSKLKDMVEVKVESYKVGVTSYWLTCLWFNVNRSFHSWDTKFSKFDL